MSALILKSFFVPPKYVGKQFNNSNGNSQADPYCYSTTLSPSKNLKIYTHDHKKQFHTHIHASNSKELVAQHNQAGLGIVHFLKGKHFLITGSTGFLGKVLIEKILRVAPDVGKIYVLINSENTEVAVKRLKNEIPVDMVVNTMLAAMEKHATMDKATGGDINIYHVGSSVSNPIKLGHLLGRLLHEYFTSFPLVDSKNRPIKVAPFQFFNSIEDMYAHILRDDIQQNGSSHSNDAQLKSVYLKSMKMTQMLVNVYKPYMFYRGRFDSSNIQKLVEHISDDEKKKFDFDARNIDWKYYVTNVHIPGLRRHVIEA